MILALILGFVLGASAIVFILQNTMMVAVSFISFQFETSIAVVVLVAVLTGFLMAVLLFLPSLITGSFRIRKLKKHNEQLAKEAHFQKRIADNVTDQLTAVEQEQQHPRSSSQGF